MAHLKILGAGPVRRGITRIAAQFEKDTGHSVSVEFAGAPSVRDRVLAGEAVDIAVVPQTAMAEFVTEAKVDPATRSTVGRSRMGLAVRKGDAVPDLVRCPVRDAVPLAGTGDRPPVARGRRFPMLEPKQRHPSVVQNSAVVRCQLQGLFKTRQCIL